MLDLYRFWFGAVFCIFRTRRSLMLENLALRQKLAVLKRKHPRPKLGPLDKLFWLLARRFLVSMEGDAYRGQHEDMQENIRNLASQGLIRQKTCEGPDANPRELLALTKEGSKLLHANRFLPEDQAAYYGFVKPKEANHDADIYRLYQKEITKILDQGGRKPRVVLDFELKKNLNRAFARFGTEARNEIAARHGLEVVRGKVPVPDLRIWSCTEQYGPWNRQPRIPLGRDRAYCGATP